MFLLLSASVALFIGHLQDALFGLQKVFVILVPIIKNIPAYVFAQTRRLRQLHRGGYEWEAHKRTPARI